MFRRFGYHTPTTYKNVGHSCIATTYPSSLEMHGDMLRHLMKNNEAIESLPPNINHPHSEWSLMISNICGFISYGV